MKNKMKCPKCGSTDIVRIEGGDSPYNKVRLTSKDSVVVSQYVCQNCNYSEGWIDEKDDIKTLSKLYSDIAKKSRKKAH